MLPRILVGTLYSNENEFIESQDSIKMQTFCEVHVRIIEGLSEYKAHNKLWDVFNENKKNYNLLVKVDADTVITNFQLFSEINQKLRNSIYDGVQLPLFDSLSQTKILGLGIFKSRVEFKKSRNRLFSDHSIDKRKYLIANEQQIGFEGEVGLHCPNPNFTQCYRYGLHRMKKKQYKLIERIIFLWEENKEKNHAAVIAGAVMAVNRRFANVNYGRSGFQGNVNWLLDDSNLSNFVNKNIENMKNIVKSKS